MRNQLRHFLRHHNHHRSLRPPFSSLPKPTSKITSFLHLDPHFYSSLASQAPSSSSSLQSYNFLVGLFSEPTKFPQNLDKVKEKMQQKVAVLRDELIKHNGDLESVHKVLKDLGSPLFSIYVDGSALVELLEQLYDYPQLAVEVFDWRHNHAGFSFPMTSEEYAKGIRVAGRAKDLNLAVELFTEAANNKLMGSTTYNALMAAYMVNGLAEKCQVLFCEMKEDQTCKPSIVTYNILLSVYGRLMLIDHMDATMEEIYDSGLIPTVSTYNNLIAGYLTAWMWDRMENTYIAMKGKSIKPDHRTYMLMVRGFAQAGHLEKMEEMYALLKQHSDEVNMQIIISMVCAYCKNSCANKVEKIDALLNLIPEKEYRPWLTVLLIRMFAKENQLDRMEKFIDFAVQRHTIVMATDVMRSIVTAYYRSEDVDKLNAFVKLAERAGWRLCRTIYHSLMVMYCQQSRLREMEEVIGRMENVNINSWTIKSLAILSNAYSAWGPRCKLEQVAGLMMKLGYEKWDTSLN